MCVFVGDSSGCFFHKRGYVCSLTIVLAAPVSTSISSGAPLSDTFTTLVLHRTHQRDRFQRIVFLQPLPCQVYVFYCRPAWTDTLLPDVLSSCRHGIQPL